MTTITAQVVHDTLHYKARIKKRLTTFLLRYPRWIHAEFMTHRVFSRNAGSSRAIRVEKLIEDVMLNPAIPLHWGKNQKGMQAFETNDGLVLVDGEELTNKDAWLRARDEAVKTAQAFAAAGYHKQIVNRLLEPFAHITVVASATELDNFFALRTHQDAEPHFQMLANEMRASMNSSLPVPRRVHAPFLTDADLRSYRVNELAILSTARCASTSYKTVDGFDMSLDRAVDIFDKLAKSDPIHASPFEHVGMGDDKLLCFWANRKKHGNFVGFNQLRHMPNLMLPEHVDIEDFHANGY